jgi:hypothetical protein
MDVLRCTCVADPAHMPELHEKNSALLLHCPYNGLPGLNLLLRPDAGNMRVAAATGSRVRMAKIQQARNPAKLENQKEQTESKLSECYTAA